ncbi:predicted protein [Scheffersomyces stipitis CBS 6054]|uniref:Uncharacterized protein n=1 Tax=Scheffersomyces stipitis (strain ATCC 58785 / CBS 6054 / NBRC 10063 / NRRL Y-11545) TaxID=322104 RepID=A3LTN6_PICST|nr:predicted protein [Scheffersomyces stipitis CBS 6054]ABN66094.1 predicted protein [Scheffersomyces stipitis CBS 6054]
MTEASGPLPLATFIEAIKDAPTDFLQESQPELRRSIAFLIRTNNELLEEIESLSAKLISPDPKESQSELEETYKLYSLTIVENREVIKNKREKYIALNDELVSRGQLNPEDKVKDEKNFFGSLDDMENKASVELVPTIKKDKRDNEKEDNTETKDGGDNNTNEEGVYL